MKPSTIARPPPPGPLRLVLDPGGHAPAPPPRPGIARLADQLLQLLYPGLLESIEPHGPEGPPAGESPELLRDFDLALCRALARCLALTAEPRPADRAADIAAAARSELPALRRLLLLDAQAAFNGDPSVHSVIEAIHCLPGLTAIALQRFAHVLHGLGAPVLPRLLTEAGHTRTGCDIHPGARIGRSFFIDHATGVVIGETATIGDNVKIYHGVTLGAKSFDRDQSGALVRGTKRHPDIEDDVTIYAHATILGGHTRIGAGSIIGANVWLAKSVPPGSVAYVTGGHVVVQPRTAAGSDWEI
ncbi:MAG TPA: serine O-acetyltransferase [Opitutaceae bacterium]|nr:serine O-acetyltransferase [Opitutaceae bacterium]